MRIMLFPKFIRDEETRTRTLRNCSVVIDGNNFFYDTYEESGLPFVFGSEANEHARYLRKLLQYFKNANVKCYFVFKGSTTYMEKKLLRAKPMEFDFESKYEFVTPVFLKEVCKQVLQEASLNYATCCMESKDDCVALAQDLGCPVLTNDIEYCFKKASYIPSTTIKYTRNGIQCGEYNINDFFRKHSLTEKKFALFAALSDVTVFPQNHFDELLQTWGVLDKNLYVQNKYLLKWLSGHPEDNIVNQVTEFLTNEEDKQKFLNEVERVLAFMHSDAKGVVPDYLQNNRQLKISQNDPRWFEKGVAIQNIPIPYIDLYKHKLIRGSWAIEKKGPIDSMMLSIDIIKYAYNLLNNFQTSDFSIFQPEQHKTKVSAELTINRPANIGTEMVFQNGWKNIKQLKSLFEHFLKENDINVDLINKVPSEARMLLIALTYYARKKSSEGVDAAKQVYCFIVCHVILRVVSDRQNSLRKQSSGISEEDSSMALEATEKYFRFSKKEAKEIYDENDLKTMVELQFCLLHMNYLNCLCGTSYKTTLYHRSFNGTFIYKLFHDMRGQDEDQFIEALFQTAPSVYKYVNSLITTYKELI